MIKTAKIKYFTLIEVIIAMAILSLAVVTILNYSVQASKRMGKASKRWNEEHMLSQAIEYYLLAGPKENIPPDFFPYDEYRATCEIKEPDLPDEVEAENSTWRFVTLEISIFNNDNEKVESIDIDQVLQAEDVE
jgi:prepilin-type N-terminal cleavage/methylation domain-containing protein